MDSTLDHQPMRTPARSASGGALKPNLPTRTWAEEEAVSGLSLSLAEMPPGQPCLVQDIAATGLLGQRLADMGFCPGLTAMLVRRAPLGDPLEVDLAGTRLCIRGAEAAQVRVLPLEAAPAAGEDRP